MKNYKDLNRGQWAELKLNEVSNKLPNKIVSDIGSGYGWFRPTVEKFNLQWQPFDYISKIEESTIGILITLLLKTRRGRFCSFYGSLGASFESGIGNKEYIKSYRKRRIHGFNYTQPFECTE
ncbi:hypothetical protein [Flavobacterium gawalongense]|uniref:hypothetical protein n=1 Tax=Flavobacterium gawalongense TaxID=2594432 RepID=UPI00163DA4B0|nr:hypothetical protein [Flavobacterium gawalongense]